MANKQPQQTAPAVTADWSTGAAERAAIIAAALAANAPEVELTPLASAQIAAHAAQTAYDAAVAAVANLPESVKAAALAVASDALAEANGMLAMEVAEAEIQAERANAEAEAVAASLLMPASIQQAALDSMKAAIAAKYAPAPEVSPEAPTAPTEAPAPKTKQVGKRNAAINVEAATVLASDATRASATYEHFLKVWHPRQEVGRASGTRWPSMCALGGSDGVANRADYKLLASMIRQYMRTVLNITSGAGNGTAEDNWLFALEAHSLSGGKSGDSLPQKYGHSAGIALHADGRFRMTNYGTANVRWPATDAAAMALWTGGKAPEATVPATASQNAPSTVQAPQAPTVQADPLSGAVVSVLTCRYCQAKNPQTRSTCRNCEAQEWQTTA